MKRYLLIFTLVMLVAASAFAVPPRTMSYQGVLTDNVGVVVSDGPYPMTFRLYDAAAAGALLWEETQNVLVTSGRFNVILGSTVSLAGLPFDDPYWLALRIGSDPEMTPRTELAGAPYSLTARTVEDAAITAPKIASGTVVRSLNSLTEDIDLVAGSNITIMKVGNDIEISSSGTTSDGDWNIVGSDLVSAVAGDVGIGLNPVSKLDVSNSSTLGTFTIRGRNAVGTTAAFYSNSVVTGFPTNPTALYTYAENGANGAFLVSKDAGHAVIGQSGGTGRAVWGWAFGSGHSGYFSGGQGVFIDTELEIGSSADTGTMQLFLAGSADAGVQLSSLSTGGFMRTNDELGNITTAVQPDGSAGGGGQVLVYRNESSAVGIDLNGNWSGLNSGRVTVSGTAATIALTTDISGDPSVQFPVNAINAGEIFDEAGAASNTSNVGIGLSGGVQSLLSRSINVPAAGFVLVMATGQAQASHVTGTQTTGNFGVSDNATTLPDNQDVAWIIGTTVPTGFFGTPVTPHGLFSVAAGSHTFYFLAEEVGGNITVFDLQLSLVYIPTAYGTVTSTLVSGPLPDEQTPAGQAMTAADIAAERAQSLAANEARIARELADMRVRMDRLEAELAAERSQ